MRNTSDGFRAQAGNIRSGKLPEHTGRELDERLAFSHLGDHCAGLHPASHLPLSDSPVALLLPRGPRFTDAVPMGGHPRQDPRPREHGGPGEGAALLLLPGPESSGYGGRRPRPLRRPFGAVDSRRCHVRTDLPARPESVQYGGRYYGRSAGGLLQPRALSRGTASGYIDCYVPGNRVSARAGVHSGGSD